ncbi:glycosyltransferase family 9 protein [Marinomonas pollencensis]|uniref:ADP-heptose:LPS heptosyltransferase n=1 Tax=Marinomonas pollencensis TaxID=491954 RepID=A0A3E0DW03_9GAMM|nr:glycosyltransferase family 9 protein [Marinomonas pollencensis]REG87005.1 ADP-heptose:LPS heptosyltransferase [Marinomonas pollencensis]
MTNIVLLRNRPHFGAQITAIPALRFFSQHCCNEEPLTLLSRHNVGWIFKQLPWVKDCHHSESYLAELKALNTSNNLLNLRPSNRFPVLLYKTIKNGQIFDFVNSDFAGLSSHQYGILDDEEYRALNYLKIFTKDEKELSKALAAPFFELAKTSDLSIDIDSINILVMPGSGGGEHKKWGLLNFLQTGKNIAQSFAKPCNLHVLLGPDEKQEIEHMNRLVNTDERLFVHTALPLKEITKLVSLCDLTIANDCGPSHIAQCMQKPYIGLFREPNPEWFLAHSKSIKVTPNNNQDVKTISVELITKHATHLLKHSD